MDNSTNNQNKIYIIAGIVLLVLILAVSLFLILYKPETAPTTETTQTTSEGIVIVDPEKEVYKTVLVCGVDNDVKNNIDVIILATINSTTKKISLVTLPRDTVIDSQTTGVSKISQLYNKYYQEKLASVSDKEASKQAMTLFTSDISTAFDIDINDYVLVNLSAFATLVDNLGGIEYDVPVDMEYSDPYQDLTISLKAGKQTLNGQQAEELVRFKASYNDDDLGRLNILSSFSKAILDKALNNYNFIQLSSMAIQFLGNVTTSASVTSITEYVKMVTDIGSEYTYESTRVPGTLVPSADVGSYSYYISGDAMNAFILKTMNPGHKTTVTFNKNSLFATTK